MTPDITKREWQIIDRLCMGWTNKEIARELQISPRTVEDHRSNVCKKMKVRNLVELVRKVYRLDEVSAA